MNKIEMQCFSVTNVEQCPKCDSKKYAYLEGVMGMKEICCDECDYVADGAIMISGSISYKNNKEMFIKVTRDLFNLWNTSVANLNGTKIKRVRIMKHK